MSNLADQWDSIQTPSSATLADTWDALPAEQPKANKDALGTDWQNFMAGAGKGVTDLGRGAKQILDIPAQWLESKFPGISAWSQAHGFPSAQESAAQTNASVNEAKTLDAPLMGTKAGIGGDIAGQTAAMMLPLGAASKVSPIAKTLLNPTTYKAAMAAGALQGALQPVAEGESRTLNTATGAAAGAAGNLLVNTIGRIAQPVSNVLSNAYKKSVQVLEDAGIPLDAAQKTGSAFLSKVRSAFWDNPFTSSAEAELSHAQRVGYNKAVLGTIGEQADAATPDVMNAAEQRINGVFKDVLDRNSVAVTNPVLGKIGAVQAAALTEEKKPIASMANRIVDAVQPDGTIPGQVAYGIKKDLDRLSSSADTTLAYHARQLRSTLMDAINDSLSPADQTAFATARQQFSNMKKIEPAIDRLGNGDISPAKLANVMAQKANRQASVYGKGDRQLVDLAHAGNLLLPDRNPNSGTTARAAMQIALPLAAGGAEGAYTGDWEKAGMTALSLAALPKAAQFLMNNPSTVKYLTSGIGSKPLRDIMLLPQTNPAIGGTLRRLPQIMNMKAQ